VTAVRTRSKLIRTARAARRAQSALRDLRQALAELERVEDSDLLGRYPLEPGPIDTEELGDFLEVARAEYPDQEVDIYVMAPMGRRQEDQ
jgi:hypothetical protein